MPNNPTSRPQQDTRRESQQDQPGDADRRREQNQDRVPTGEAQKGNPSRDQDDPRNRDRDRGDRRQDNPDVDQRATDEAKHRNK